MNLPVLSPWRFHPFIFIGKKYMYFFNKTVQNNDVAKSRLVSRKQFAFKTSYNLQDKVKFLFKRKFFSTSIFFLCFKIAKI